MLTLEPRQRQPRLLQGAAPVLAVLITMVAGGILFAALGKNPVEAIRIIFLDPLLSPLTSSSDLEKGL
ncbi:MAG: ABC transporter permease, partial [Pseudomonadota bacterium]